MNHTEKNGFTLIELLIAMAISSIVMGAIIAAYQVQVRGKNAQETITDMNQTARLALEIMADEIRMARLNPSGTSSAGSSIILAREGEIAFSLDKGDGLTNEADQDCCDRDEVIRYRLSDDAAGDGLNDHFASAGGCHLARETGCALFGIAGGALPPCCPGAATRSGFQNLGFNVDALDFVYLNVNGVPLATPVATPAAIRTIQITMVARSGTQSEGFLYNFTNNQAYTNQQGAVILPARADHFRRLLLTTTVYCRN